jgi:hypothetical protein
MSPARRLGCSSLGRTWLYRDIRTVAKQSRSPSASSPRSLTRGATRQASAVDALTRCQAWFSSGDRLEVVEMIANVDVLTIVVDRALGLIDDECRLVAASLV